MDFEDRNQKFKELMRNLIELAKKDEIITSEEERVLNTVEISVKQYERALNRAVEDGIISSEERLKLANIENNLLSTTFELVERDETLDSDTKNLVELLFDTLMNIL